MKKTEILIKKIEESKIFENEVFWLWREGYKYFIKDKNFKIYELGSFKNAISWIEEEEERQQLREQF